MFQYLVDEKDFLPSKKIDEKGLEALNSKVRRDILEKVSSSKKTVSDIVEELELDQQTAYYHLGKLREAGIVEKDGTKPAYFSSEKIGYYYQPGYVEPKENPVILGEVPPILEGFVSQREIKAKVVVGAPYPHGEYDKRYRTGYKAGEICALLGNYGKTRDRLVYMDTELENNESLKESPLISVAGPLVNTLSAELNNDNLPAKFDDSFNRVVTDENVYTDEEVGIIVRTDEEPARMMLAGLYGIGTAAAIKALSSRAFELGENGAIVRGYGTKHAIDDIEILEKL